MKNRRLLSPNGSGPIPKSDRFLRPGPLAQIRDSKIRIRSPPRPAAKIHLVVPPPSPVRPLATIDGSPRFAGRIHGPRLFNKRRLVASKRIFFMPSDPDPISDWGLDLFAAH